MTSDSAVRQFREQGFAGPLRIMPAEEAGRVLTALRSQKMPPLAWEKGSAPVSRWVFETGTRPDILDVVEAMIGGDFVLWGATLLERKPGDVHHWHSDMESCAPDARTVSVWLGLQGTTPDSSLLVIPGSHLFAQTVQEARGIMGASRGEASAEALAEFAREHHGTGVVAVAGAHDGEAIVFDGRLWHGSSNVGPNTRWALLLQYAAPSTPIRIPDPNTHDWPFRKLDSPRPPCLVVRGSVTSDVNLIVPPPIKPGAREIRLTSRIDSLRLPVASGPESGFQQFQRYRGATAHVPWLKCHASMLSPGVAPHEPIRHPQEELVVLVAGELDVHVEAETLKMSAGDVAFYPSNILHTILATGSQAATYVILKWQGDEEPGAEDLLALGIWGTDGPKHVVFDRPTRWLRRLACHTTVLQPGAGYDPHADAYDVAIVALEGELETIGGRAAPGDVIFYVAGEEHGMRNVGDLPARYVVFEFHGRTSGSAIPPANGAVSDAPGLAGAVKRRLRRLARD